MKQVGRKNNKTTHTNKKQLKNEEKQGKPGDEAGWEKNKKITHTNKKQLRNEEKHGKPGDEAGWEKNCCKGCHEMFAPPGDCLSMIMINYCW